jgi:hypothetical protein
VAAWVAAALAEGSVVVAAAAAAAVVVAAHAADIGRLTAQREDEVRDALHRALALLDELQQPAAKKLLDDRGIDPDSGRPTTGAQSAKGASSGDDGDDDASGGSDSGSGGGEMESGERRK